MIQKIAILVVREGRVTGTQIFSVYEVGEDAECSFFFPNMSAYFCLGCFYIPYPPLMCSSVLIV